MNKQEQNIRDEYNINLQILFNKLSELDSKEQIFYALDDLGFITYVTNHRIHELENLLIYSIELKQFDVAEYCLTKIQDELKKF